MTAPLLPAGAAGWVAPITALVALVALVLSLIAIFLRRPGPVVVEAPADERSYEGFERRLQNLEARFPTAVQHLALVRFDAFPGAGGQFSFSAAFLDGDATGVVLTAISGREETRLYAKRLESGKSEQPLSPEEQEALKKALEQAPNRR